MDILITKSVSDKLPDFDIIALSADVTLNAGAALDGLIKETEQTIYEEYSLAEVLNIPLIKVARDSYKLLGVDPSRTRLACESLLRRIVKGNRLYRINNVVDIGNILSIALTRSTAILDYAALRPPLFVRLGTAADEYYGIGRGRITVTGLPLYCDAGGPFGCPTSDVERTMIRPETERIMIFVICFDNHPDRSAIIGEVKRLYETFAAATAWEEHRVVKE